MIMNNDDKNNNNNNNNNISKNDNNNYLNTSNNQNKHCYKILQQLPNLSPIDKANNMLNEKKTDYLSINKQNIFNSNMMIHPPLIRMDYDQQSQSQSQSHKFH